MIPGDGVGIEVVREATKVLDIAASKHSVKFVYTWFDWGCDYYLANNMMNPENMLEILMPFDAIILGSVGDESKVPDHISLRLLLTIRKGFDQYVNLRPIKLYPGVYSPLKLKAIEDVDMVFIRENTEGEYSNLGGHFKLNCPEEIALQTAVFTRQGIERVIRYAFTIARKRSKLQGLNGYKGMVTNCTKSNALNFSMVLWDDIYKEVSTVFPNIKQDKMLVDALAMRMVNNPGRFDVIVASNLFGDILTDLGAAIQGGMGFAASANINPEKKYPSMFEPVHGSAPDIAGENKANPVAAIESVRMMTEHLGEIEIASDITKAIKAVLAKQEIRTIDMGGTNSTSQMGDAIAEMLV